MGLGGWVGGLEMVEEGVDLRAELLAMSTDTVDVCKDVDSETKVQALGGQVECVVPHTGGREDRRPSLTQLFTNVLYSLSSYHINIDVFVAQA